MAHFQNDWDILLTPTLAERPLPLGVWVMTCEDIDDYYDRLFRYIAFTPQQNLSGQPAITLPLYMRDDGLPVGGQLASRFGEELLVVLRMQERLLGYKKECWQFFRGGQGTCMRDSCGLASTTSLLCGLHWVTLSFKLNQ